MPTRFPFVALAFECSHSSGCHERFATLQEFQEHWEKVHKKPSNANHDTKEKGKA